MKKRPVCSRRDKPKSDWRSVAVAVIVEPYNDGVSVDLKNLMGLGKWQTAAPRNMPTRVARIKTAIKKMFGEPSIRQYLEGWVNTFSGGFKRSMQHMR